MATVEAHSLEELDELAIPRFCMVCGGPTAAYWVGHQAVSVCTNCALEVLPKLIADAAGGLNFRVAGAMRRNVAMRAEEVLREVERQYWHAMAYRLAREGEKLQK